MDSTSSYKNLLPSGYSVLSQRFGALARDRQMWLSVCADRAGGGDSSNSDPHRPGGLSFRSLQQAVQSARPGDTIWLAPGMEHEVSAVVIPIPLVLIGGGSLSGTGTTPEATVLTVPRGASCGLDFRCVAMWMRVA